MNARHGQRTQAPDDDCARVRPSPRFRLVSPGALRRLAVLFSVLAILVVLTWSQLIRMPGRAHNGPLPPLTESQQATADSLRSDVEVLAARHPNRHVFNPMQYANAARFIEQRFTEAGLTPVRESFTTRDGRSECLNIIAEIPGSTLPGEILVLGAHYDSYMGTPGADDNASGVACLLALAERLAGSSPSRTIRFIAFANEEPPHFMTPDMGSHVHAHQMARSGEAVHLMISLEMLGYYDDTPGSQRYPPPLSMFYPDTGDFVAIVGNVASRSHVRRMVRGWRDAIPFPCYGAALPSGIPGIGFSDHWSFWQAGYDAVMITDTSFYRNPHYHTRGDTPETLDYERMARVVDGLEFLVRRESTSSSR